MTLALVLPSLTEYNPGLYRMEFRYTLLPGGNKEVGVYYMLTRQARGHADNEIYLLHGKAVVTTTPTGGELSLLLCFAVRAFQYWIQEALVSDLPSPIPLHWNASRHRPVRQLRPHACILLTPRRRDGFIHTAWYTCLDPTTQRQRDGETWQCRITNATLG